MAKPLLRDNCGPKVGVDLRCSRSILFPRSVLSYWRLGMGLCDMLSNPTQLGYSECIQVRDPGCASKHLAEIPIIHAEGR
jgi:hypothetical protein